MKLKAVLLMEPLNFCYVGMTTGCSVSPWTLDAFVHFLPPK